MRKKFTILLILIFVLGLTPINFSSAVTQNQIDAEVQIVCTDGNESWFSGSGTIIDPKGIILTNRHVIEGAYENTCFIGFIESISQEPNFGTEGNYNLAKVEYYTTTDDMDAAILYLDNPTNKTYSYINIWDSNSDSLQFGDKVEAIGFPSIGGSTITYTSGDFSGFGSDSNGTQNYIKTTTQLEHGNSGGASYNSNGQFVGIPTMVVAGSLNSLSYILSVNSIKSWLSRILGTQYQKEITKQKPIQIESTISIQNDITPPYLDEFGVNIYGYDDNGKMLNFSYKYGNNTSVIYEFNNIKLAWAENCKGSACINDNSGRIKGYYYYFGKNINSIPKFNGKYVSAEEIIKTKDPFGRAEVQLPETFTLEKEGNYYFILQAVDYSDNISNPLINFEYIYEPDKFKDIEDININDSENNLIGNLDYPVNEEMPVCNNNKGCKGKVELGYVINTIHTNQNTLYLYPNYGYNINGLVYYISYGEDRWWHDKVRTGISTKNKFIKIENIKTKGMINIFIKPYSDSMLSFFGKYHTLTINYDENISTKILPSDKTYISGRWDSYDSWAKLKFTEIDEKLINRLKGRVILQVESMGEAYYVNPKDSLRYYMANGDEAYRIMRYLGVGITNSDLERVMTDNIFAKKHSGKIFLQVEANGEAYYIDIDGDTHYLKNGSFAYSVMRDLGLGIANSDLIKIPEGGL